MSAVNEWLDKILKKNKKTYADLTQEEKTRYNKYYEYLSKSATIDDVKNALQRHSKELLEDMRKYDVIGDRAIFLKACYNVNEYILSVITKDETQRKVVEETLKNAAESEINK